MFTRGFKTYATKNSIKTTRIKIYNKKSPNFKGNSSMKTSKKKDYLFWKSKKTQKM